MDQPADHDDDIQGALAALEQFVVDNDDLLQLEERIGRFNIFDALRIVGREAKHSDFLAWLLDPNESHSQGGLFLRDSDGPFQDGSRKPVRLSGVTD